MFTAATLGELCEFCRCFQTAELKGGVVIHKNDSEVNTFTY